MYVNPTRKKDVVRLGEDRVSPRFHEFVHADVQYRSSQLVCWYHHYVLRRCISAAPTLKPGDTVLDYGCGTQNLKGYMPEGVSYVGYDFVAELSDIDDPRGMKFDAILAIQMLMCLDRDGIVELMDVFADATSHLVAFVPARTLLKDEVMDRVLGLTNYRDALVQSKPDEIWDILKTRFSLTDRQNIFWMGDLTSWERK